MRLAELESRPQQLEEFFTWLSEAPNRHGHQRSAATVRRVYAVLRAALNSAVRRRMLTFNPLLAVELPEARRAKVTTWTAEQAVAFLIFLEGDEQEGRRPERLRALYHLALASSMRRGELLGQRWDTDLKTDQAVTHVAEQLVKMRHGGVVVGAPKTRAGVRPLWFDEYTAQVLAEHRQRQEAERAAWGEAWVDTGLVFTREHGSALNPDHVSRRFRTLAKRAGIPVIRFHDLRHTSISLGLGTRRRHQGDERTGRSFVVVVHRGHLRARRQCAGTGGRRAHRVRDLARRYPCGSQRGGRCDRDRGDGCEQDVSKGGSSVARRRKRGPAARMKPQVSGGGSGI
ncbi:MAG: tyrosine-type recombinase/integrase [Frankiaceae bacterium]